MSRPARLKAAKRWISEYRGNNLVRGYKKWFGVSDVCAVLELRMLGVDIPDARLEQARRDEQVRAVQRIQRKQVRTAMDEVMHADETFVFVAGCTPGGAPYGIEQDVADAAWEQSLAWSRVRDEMDADSDLPF